MMALATTGLVGDLPAAAYLGSASEGASATLPFLFAGASGALAVASALTAWAIWRRAQAAERRADALERREQDDLSTELVFTATPGRLSPASPATLRFLAAAFKSQEEGFSLDRAGLDALIGAEGAAALNQAIAQLLRRGAGFRFEGPDARGGLWSFVGETVGARAVVRLIPQGRAAGRQAAQAAQASKPARAAESAAAADWRSMLEAAPGGVAAFDAERRLALANETAQRLLRLSPDWIATRPTLRAFLDHLHRRQRMPEQADFAAWRAKVMDETEAPLAEPTLWALPNGEALRVAAKTTPDGGLAFFVSDETSALTLERRVNIAMGARRATITAVDQGLAVVGGDGAVQLLNPAFARIWDLDAVFGPNCAERFMADGDGGPIPLSEVAAAAARNGSPEDRAIWERIETAALRRNAPRRPERFAASRRAPGGAAGVGGAAAREQDLSIRVTPLPDGASLIACVDVSDAKAVERALRDKAEALEAADRLKTDFLTDMAYQLRTPLNAVIGFADMMNQGLAGPLGDRQKDYVGYVLSAANDLRELIGDALDLGALRAGSLALRRAPFDLAPAAATVAAMAAKRADRRRAIFVASIAEIELPMLGDERRLRHALFGALAAALNEAEPNDEARFLVRRAERRPDRAEVVVALARRKQRKTPERQSAAEPGGVSLSLARRIVEAHGGAAEIEETPLGLRARFLLPLRREEPEAAPVAEGGR